MTLRTVTVPGGQLQVFDEGSGPPFVLLHAGIVDSRAWTPLVARLIPAGFRTVAFDRRGYGASVTEDVEFSNRDDVRAVMDGLGIARACLIGNSVGGQVAVDVAVETPERVAALVTVGASIGGYEPEPTAVEAALFEEMERLETSGDPEAVADFHVRLWLDGIGQPPTRLSPDLREEVRAMALEVGDPSRVFGRPVPLRPRAAERLAALTMPVLAIAGALDVSDVPATASHLAATVTGARALVLADVAHLVGMEAPDRLAAAILALVEPLGSWR